MQIDYHWALVGGLCIGLASFVASASTGKIPGVSGVFAKIWMGAKGDRLWRLLMVLGLIAGAGIGFLTFQPSFRPVAPLWLMVIAGFLVGLGTRLGGGCTSGHGVCGMGLGAKDSIVATLIFMGAGVLTVFVVRHLLGGLG